MNFLREMEETEEVLKRMTEVLTPGQWRERQLIERLFVDLKDRQTISSAALQAKDAYTRIKEEKEEVLEREKRHLPRFGRWCTANPPDGTEEHQLILDTQDKLTNLISKFLAKWEPLGHAMVQVREDLKELNKSLAGLPERLEEMESPLLLEQFYWPTHLCHRVTDATELAFDLIRRMNRFLGKIDEQFEVLEIVCVAQKGNNWTSQKNSGLEMMENLSVSDEDEDES